jgi:hypothetical protein
MFNTCPFTVDPEKISSLTWQMEFVDKRQLVLYTTWRFDSLVKPANGVISLSGENVDEAAL